MCIYLVSHVSITTIFIIFIIPRKIQITMFTIIGKFAYFIIHPSQSYSIHSPGNLLVNLVG